MTQRLAEFNIGVLRYDWDDPRVADFADNLERVRAESDEDPQALLLLSQAWLSLGQQRAFSQGSHVAEYEEGRKNYENALELVRKVRAADPERLDAKQVEGALLMLMGDLAVSQRQMEEARRWYEQRLELAKQLTDQDENPAQLEALASAYDRMGGMAGMSGDHQRALVSFEVSLGLARRVFETTGSPRARRQWATAHGRIGGALSELGRYDEALSMYDQQLEVLEQLIEEDPASASLEAQWVVVTELRSRPQIALRKLDDAEAALSDALKRVEQLIAADSADARLPVFEIAVTFGLGNVAATRS